MAAEGYFGRVGSPAEYWTHTQLEVHRRSLSDTTAQQPIRWSLVRLWRFRASRSVGSRAKEAARGGHDDLGDASSPEPPERGDISRPRFTIQTFKPNRRGGSEGGREGGGELGVDGWDRHTCSLGLLSSGCIICAGEVSGPFKRLEGPGKPSQ